MKGGDLEVLWYDLSDPFLEIEDGSEVGIMIIPNIISSKVPPIKE